MALIPNIEQTAERFIQLLPLIYTKFNKPIAQPFPVQKKSSDLTHLQYHILEELLHAEAGFSMTQLAQIIHISKQQLTPLVNKLEEKAYIIKVPDAKDKRRVRLQLTEKGKAAVKQRWEEFHRLLCGRISELHEDDLLDLDFAIAKIIRILGKLK
jgi:DNA-binding MarR family transcriptional regulator